MILNNWTEKAAAIVLDYFDTNAVIKRSAIQAILDEHCPFKSDTAYEEVRVELPLCAAVRLSDGYIVRGHRHDDCLKTGWELRSRGRSVDVPAQEDQGFYTSYGRFVSREDGARLFRAIGALSAHTGLPFTGRILFSEDLY